MTQAAEPLLDVSTTLGKAEDELAPEVHRRPFGHKLRRQLNQIVSMYIPSNNETGRVDDDDDSEARAKLLPTKDILVEFSSIKIDHPYDIRLLYSAAVLLKPMTESVGQPSCLASGSPRKVVAIAADDQTIYVTLESLPYVFLVRPPSSPHSSTTNTEIAMHANPLKGHIELKIPQIGKLVPHEITVYSPTLATTVLYVVGWVHTRDCETVDNIQRRWLLAKFATNGKHLGRTRIYDYQRYSGIAVDSTDKERLLLACPRLTSPQESPSEPREQLPDDQGAGQLCKLTPGFERRVFSVTMGTDKVIYRPEFVAQESAGNFCWASVQRWTRSTPASRESAPNGQPAVKGSRRLFSFPGRQLNNSEELSPRRWLQIASWDFGDLNPGRIASFDTDRLLVLDSDTGTLSCITWQREQDKPSLHRITRPKTTPIELLCTTYSARGPESDGDAGQPYAYFVAGSCIYSFAFRTTPAARLPHNSIEEY